MKRIRKPSSSQSGQIRIIAGKHRGRKLPVIDIQGLRPTTDKQKETLFNWLMMDVLEAKCLDVFAGAGSLGIEALSRGASKLVMLEKSKQAANQLKSNIDLLGFSQAQAQVIEADALHALTQATQVADASFDIIFIDPPFQKNLVQPCIDILVAQNYTTVGTKIYIETEPNCPYQTPINWKLIKEGKSHQTNTQLYECV